VNVLKFFDDSIVIGMFRKKPFVSSYRLLKKVLIHPGNRCKSMQPQRLHPLKDVAKTFNFVATG